MERQYRVLIVDNDKDILTTYQNYLTKHGLEVETAQDGVEGLGKLRTGEFDVAVVEIQLPKMNGIEMIKKANEAEVDTDIVVLSGEGEGDRNDAIAAINAGVSAWFEKSRLVMGDLLKKVKELSGFMSLNEIEQMLSAIHQHKG